MLPNVLTYEASVSRLSWPGAIDALRRGHQRLRPEQRDLLLGSDDARLLNRAARIEGLGFAVKADSVFPANAQRGLPSVQGAVLLFDPSCGAVRAVIESRLITQYKTAADSLLGAQCLARPDSRHLVILGAGAVAGTLARAYDTAFPGIKRISIWSRRPEQAEALVTTLGDLRARVIAVTDLQEAVRAADIVSTATMARSPILRGEWVCPGTHVDLVGAFTPDMREADDELIAAGLVYVDFMETVMDRIGEVMLPIAAGVIERAHVRGDLYDLVAAGPTSREDLTPITGITKKVLEDAGYTVKVTEFSEWGVAFAALSHGDIQILTSQTDYAAHDYWDRNKNKLEKLSPVSHGLYQAIAVPKYVTIDSLDQINDNADKFGGKIIGIEPGAGLMRDSVNAVKAYGLKLQLVEGSTAAMTAALKSAIDRKEWVAVTLWTPSWMAEKYDIKFLKDPKGVYPPPQSYYWIGHKGFSAEYPHAREVLASVYVPIDDITAINGAVKDGKSMDEATKAWIDAHADLIKRWEDTKSE
jgi:ornithine cyclodeaminase